MSDLLTATGRNDLVEWHPFKKAWLPAYSNFRSRQVKRKRLELAKSPLPRLHTKPNDLGNYVGKRTPKELPSPMTPSERFARLSLAFQIGASPAAGGSPARVPRGRQGKKRRGFRVHTFKTISTAPRHASSTLICA